MIGLYERYVRVLFERYGHRVRYWLTFNEINSVLHSPLMSGGINTPKEQLTQPTCTRRSTTSWWPAPGDEDRPRDRSRTSRSAAW